WQVGLYTVSHSLALALAAFGLVKIDASIVAPVVAISALYLVIENLFVNEMKWWRGAAIFGFGLFHGFAFSELLWTHQPRLSELLPALIGFNLGIELAQLVVLIIASIVAVSLAKRPWFRHGVVVPLCVIIAGIAFFRFIDVMWLH
ncbi:MAG: HupE/UreJ family protein, partial [Verrucomicrobiae bacterium]|nr:HupE/UreJ family protein [Verrucomicrobiae bacterium]